MKRLTLVTFNTWKCDGALHRRIDLMTRGLSALNADIILLQEVFASVDGEFNTGQLLAGQLEMHCVFHPGRRKQREVEGVMTDSYSGLAVLSRQLPGESGAIPLPSDPRDGERWAQWVRLQVGDERLGVINTHLSHLRDREDLRECQMRRIIKQVAAQANSDTLVLGGYLNTQPGSAILTWLEQQRFLPARSIWREGGNGEIPATVIENETGVCIAHLYRLGNGRSALRWTGGAKSMNWGDEFGVLASDYAAVVGVLSDGT